MTKDELLETGPLWDRTYQSKIGIMKKVVGRWRKLAWWFYDFPHVVDIPDSTFKFFLNPIGRKQDFRFETPNGFDAQHWFRDNGKGLMKISVYRKQRYGSGSLDYKGLGRLEFTDPRTALMAKLTLGGQ
jgi:hypothetical protein